MKISVIGCSGHYHQLLEAMRERETLCVTAYAPGREQENMASLAKALPDAKAYADWRAMLDEQQPELVVVNPWYCDHAKISMECLRRGIHVYSEKPLATEQEELEALYRVWQESPADLGGMFNLRYCGWFRTVCQLMEAGEIGEVRLLHGQKSYKMGTRPAFYRERALYGGMLPWVGIHAIDWVLQLGGQCLRVSAAQSAAHNGGQGELETGAVMLLEMENGVMGTVSADYFRPDGSARHDDDRLRVTGTRGMIEVVDGRVWLENDLPKREIPVTGRKNAFLVFMDALGTEEAKRQAQSAFEVTNVALCGRQAGDEERMICVKPMQ